MVMMVLGYVSCWPYVRFDTTHYFIFFRTIVVEYEKTVSQVIGKSIAYKSSTIKICDVSFSGIVQCCTV